MAFLKSHSASKCCHWDTYIPIFVYGQYTAVSVKGKQQTSLIQEKVLLRIYGSTEHGIFRREDEVKLAVVQSIHRSL